MISIISGAILAGGGGAGIWLLRPRNGQPHHLAKLPFLDSMIPIGIVAALAIGVAMIVAGFIG